MRGRQTAEKLDVVRAAKCSHEGLQMITQGKIPAQCVQNLYEAHTEDPSKFVETTTSMIYECCEQLMESEDPNAAIKMMYLTGLLVDRLTQKALINAPGVERNNEYKRSSTGIFVYDGNGNAIKTIPYRGRN